LIKQGSRSSSYVEKSTTTAATGKDNKLIEDKSDSDIDAIKGGTDESKSSETKASVKFGANLVRLQSIIRGY